MFDQPGHTQEVNYFRQSPKLSDPRHSLSQTSLRTWRLKVSRTIMPLGSWARLHPLQMFLSPGSPLYRRYSKGSTTGKGMYSHGKGPAGVMIPFIPAAGWFVVTMKVHSRLCIYKALRRVGPTPPRTTSSGRGFIPFSVRVQEYPLLPPS